MGVRIICICICFVHMLYVVILCRYSLNMARYLLTRFWATLHNYSSHSMVGAMETGWNNVDGRNTSPVRYGKYHINCSVWTIWPWCSSSTLAVLKKRHHFSMWKHKRPYFLPRVFLAFGKSWSNKKVMNPGVRVKMFLSTKVWRPTKLNSLT